MVLQCVETTESGLIIIAYQATVSLEFGNRKLASMTESCLNLWEGQLSPWGGLKQGGAALSSKLVMALLTVVLLFRLL
jgi:hypothetical protein